MEELTDITQAETKVDGKSSKETVNIMDFANSEEHASLLEVVRLGSNETAVIAFTPGSIEANLHYVNETEVGGYALCNGRNCLLCRVGRKYDERLLVPVYLPESGSVGVLPVSKSLRPAALLPQFASVLKADKPLVMFITREGAKYTVATQELRPEMDGGEVIIKRFLEDFEKGKIDLTSVYQKIENDQLASIEGIQRMMALKGIRLNESDQHA
jgi:hypothetical protein